MIRRLWERLLARLFPKITSYRLSRPARKAMRALSEHGHPNESFGVLRGDHRGSVLVVREVGYQPFIATGRSANVAIDPYAVQDLVGTFHSHPVPDARPSAADKRLYARYPGVHCIAAWPYAYVHVYDQSGNLLGIHPL